MFKCRKHISHSEVTLLLFNNKFVLKRNTVLLLFLWRGSNVILN